MIIDGKVYERDWKGFYRCPYPDCHHPDFPARKFKTDAGFIKHLSECKARPYGSGVWHKPPDPPKVLWGLCADCGKEIYEMESCWPMSDRTVCVSNGCWEKYCEQGIGFHDCAGLKFPEITLSQ
jgi:hypothetical protein